MFTVLAAAAVLPARTVAETFEQFGQVHLFQPVRDAGCAARADPAGQLHPVRNLKILPVRDRPGDVLRHEDDRSSQGGRNGGDQENGKNLGIYLQAPDF